MKFPIYQNNNENVTKFVTTLAPIVVSEYLYRKTIGDKVISPTVVIAQAALESGWNLEAKSLFGIKGDGTISPTKEFIGGEWVDTQAMFVDYPDLTSAVKGYYDLMQWSNYDDATSAPAGEQEVIGLTNDIGYPYATAPNYKDVIMAIINDFGLNVFNDYVYQPDIDWKVDRVNDDICVIKNGNGIYIYTLTNFISY